MKKFLAIVSLIILTTITFSAPPVEVVNPSLRVNVISTPQPEDIEIYNVSISTGQIKLLVNKNWDYSYFYIFNTSDYTLQISTSPTFVTYFRLPKGGIFASDVLTTLYGRLVDGSGVIDVLIEKK